MTVEIVKNDGEKELFLPEKLRDSLIKAHTSTVTADEIVEKINKIIKDGMSTSEIYEKAFAILNEKEKKSAAMYSIRRSLLDLGPSGFPFEKFVAEIFKKKNYQTQTGATLQGKCTAHEVDMVAYDEDTVFFAEIKFHNQLSIKTDTKVALYVKARFDDLASQKFVFDGKERKLTKGLLITNTKFTDNAIRYAECAGGIEFISWDYPKNGNLYDLISETELQPTTCIEILSKKEKMALIDKGLVNCKSLKDNSAVMKELGISDSKIKEVVENIDNICSV